MTHRSFISRATGPAIPRVDAAAGTTNLSAVVTDAAAVAGDVGKPVSGTNIPAGAFIVSVSAGVSFTMSAAATGTGTVSATIGAPLIDAGSGNTFRNFGLHVTSPAPDCVVALETSPDGTTWTEQDRVTGPAWAYVAMHHARREVRANVISLGTGTPPLAACLTYSH